ncbi:GATA transcription factor 9-like [Olea europaea var. sylvestris]|uniref:GATA transcription factor 9-like n=1 Tax=Olea europaea var. sylvestris TaxID=158386 RepID=UPI000C1CD6A7|nr:GATA transcription factor 9-like [Olea europaea var. sylvestris]
MMEYFMGDYAEFSSVDNINLNSNGNGAHFTVDDLLDFSKEDVAMTDAFFDSLAGNSGESSAVTAVDSCNSSLSDGGDGLLNGHVSCRSFIGSQFSGHELCVPCDDLAELEWLSKFVEESFSSDDVHNLHFIPAEPTAASSSSSATKISVSPINHSPPPPPIFPSHVPVPGKARSKRSRAAPCDWSSRLLLSSPPSSTSNNHYGNATINANPNHKPMKTPPSKKRGPTETPGRKCLHCASEKTPQWRTGPMGPKTLCNACGVRYKSGRLVPEYRPAASPTFVSTKHSNSHRKVVELLRQKELQMQLQQQHQGQLLSQTSIFNINGCDDFLIHRHNGADGPDFKHVI